MIYKLYNKLPVSLKSKISRVNYSVSGKPKVNTWTNLEKKFPGTYKGGLIISADFELGWAVRYSKHPKDPEEFGIRERKNIPVILNHIEKYQIPVSWSTVGHLFLEKCKKGDHDWMHRLPYFDDHWRFQEGDWFDHDPYSNYKDAPAWYAPDLIKEILACKTKQEIAFHTFSHIDCSYKNCPIEVIDDEFKEGIRIAKEWGLKFQSLTFPGGKAGNYETLKKYGIEIVRQRYKDYELSYPYLNDHNMIVTPTGPAITIKYKEWPLDYTISMYKKAIDKALRTGTFAHLWFHPSQKKEDFTELMPAILEYADKKRREGQLWVTTMGNLADFINKNGP
jgi:hypothetical protein